MEKLRDLKLRDYETVANYSCNLNSIGQNEIRSGYVEVLAELPKPVIDNNLRLVL